MFFFSFQIVCALSHVSVSVFQVYVLIRGCLQFKTDPVTNIVTLFDSVRIFTYIISMLLLINNLWRRYPEIWQILEHTRCNREDSICEQSCVLKLIHSTWIGVSKIREFLLLLYFYFLELSQGLHWIFRPLPFVRSDQLVSGRWFWTLLKPWIITWHQ